MNNSNHIELWLALKNGSQEALAELYNLYIDELIRYGYRVSRNRELVVDSIQDLFLTLWQSRRSLSETDSVRFYLFRALRNRINRNQGLEGPLNSVDIGEISELVSDLLHPEAEQIVREEDQDRVKRLKTAIDKLPTRQREIIQLRYYSDFSMEEIGQIMDINIQSARNLLFRAISELRKWLIFIFISTSPLFAR